MNFKLGVIILFLSASSSQVMGQLKTELLPTTALPKNISYQGKPVQIIRYEDKTGTYLALITQTGVQPQKGEDDNHQAHLYGYLYQLNGAATPTQIWTLHDQVTDCLLDIVAGFVPGSMVVTDLDKNGKAEVWVVYRLACRGDVSPGELKIIMHEGMTKYAMRGIGRIKIGNTIQHDGGVITSNDFKKGAVTFSQYAGNLWNKYLTEVIR